MACNNASEQTPDNNDTQIPDEPVEEGVPQTLQAGQNFTGHTSFTYGEQGGGDDSDGFEVRVRTLCKSLRHAHTQAIVEVIDSEGFGTDNCQGQYARTVQRVYVRVWAVAAGVELEHETYIVDVEGTGFGYRPKPGEHFLISARLVDKEWVRTSAIYIGDEGFENRYEDPESVVFEIPNDFDELHRQSSIIISDIPTHCPEEVENLFSDEEWAQRLYSHEYWGCGIDDVEAGDPNRR